MGKFFEEIGVGEKYTSSGRTITESDIVLFSGVSGDYNPLHTDRAYTETTQFKERIAHGALTFSVMTGMWDQLGLLRGTVVAFYGVEKMRFLRPVYIGDTLHLEMEITKKEDRGEDGFVTMANRMVNQKNGEVMVCESVVLVRKKPNR